MNPGAIAVELLSFLEIEHDEVKIAGFCGMVDRNCIESIIDRSGLQSEVLIKNTREFKS